MRFAAASRGVVHQFTNRRGGAAIAVLALRLHRRLGVKERKLRVVWEHFKVLVLTGQFSK